MRQNTEEYRGVFTFAQQVDGKLSGISLELIGKGKDLAADLNTEVTAVLLGSDIKGLVEELAEHGADKIIVVDDPKLKEYRTEPYTQALSAVISVLQQSVEIWDPEYQQESEQDLQQTVHSLKSVIIL